MDYSIFNSPEMITMQNSLTTKSAACQNNYKTQSSQLVKIAERLGNKVIDKTCTPSDLELFLSNLIDLPDNVSKTLYFQYITLILLSIIIMLVLVILIAK